MYAVRTQTKMAGSWNIHDGHRRYPEDSEERLLVEDANSLLNDA